MKHLANGAISPLLVLAILLVAGLGTWWFLREPPLQPGELRVTYEHGEKCIWRDWTFRVRREVANNRVMGNALSVGRPDIQVKDDSWLRVYDPNGEKLYVQADDLREMRFTSRPSNHNTSNNEVLALDLVTASGTIRFKPVELPRFSRSRVMVPVASRLFADQSDDYMSWGNVRLTLKGTPVPECSIDREISLTRTGHSKKRTPVLIEFGYREF